MLPALVACFTAIVGNAVGYARLVDVMSIYCRSYDLPPFGACYRWSAPEPLWCLSVMLAAITWIGVRRKLGATPLAFLRHEIGHRSRRHRLASRGAGLSDALSRRDVFLRNASPSRCFLRGIMFSTLLLFGLCMLPMIGHYAGDGTLASRPITSTSGATPGGCDRGPTRRRGGSRRAGRLRDPEEGPLVICGLSGLVSRAVHRP